MKTIIISAFALLWIVLYFITPNDMRDTISFVINTIESAFFSFGCYCIIQSRASQIKKPVK